MQFFILLPGDTEKDAIFETNLLGEIAFKNFWVAQGFDILSNMIHNHPEECELITILDDKKKKYTIEEFFIAIKDKNIIHKP